MQSLQAVLRMQQQQQHKPGLVSRVKRHSAHVVRLSSTLMIVTLADRYKRLSSRLFSDACLVSHPTCLPFTLASCLSREKREWLWLRDVCCVSVCIDSNDCIQLSSLSSASLLLISSPSSLIKAARFGEVHLASSTSASHAHGDSVDGSHEWIQRRISLPRLQR